LMPIAATQLPGRSNIDQIAPRTASALSSRVALSAGPAWSWRGSEGRWWCRQSALLVRLWREVNGG